MRHGNGTDHVRAERVRRGPVRTIVGLAAAGLVLVPVAACSSDDEPAGRGDFCQDGAQVVRMFQEEPPQGHQELRALAADLADRFAAVDPPAEIAEHWSVLTQLMGDITTAMDELDPQDDETAAMAFSLRYTEVDPEQLSNASEAVDEYTSEHCGG